MFKVGDKIVCINSDCYYKDLKLNKIYTVFEYHPNNDYSGPTIQLYNMNNIYYCHRFKTMTQIRKEKIEKICLRLEIK